MREANKLVLPKYVEDVISKGYCPSCGLHKSAWKRRTDWKCCSKLCTNHLYSNLVIATSWPDLRIQVFDRDNKTCKICNGRFDYSELEADHIIPIALGGDQWDKSNIQTLCYYCHKIKTKSDMKNIRIFLTKEEKQEMINDAIEAKEIRPN